MTGNKPRLGPMEPGIAVEKEVIKSESHTPTPQSHSGWGLDWSQLVQVNRRELNPLGLQVLIHLFHSPQLRSASEGICPVLDEA